MLLTFLTARACFWDIFHLFFTCIPDFLLQNCLLDNSHPVSTACLALFQPGWRMLCVFLLPSGGSCQIMASVWAGACEEQPCLQQILALLNLALCTNLLRMNLIPHTYHWIPEQVIVGYKTSIFPGMSFLCSNCSTDISPAFEKQYKFNKEMCLIKNTKMLLGINWCKFDISLFFDI